MFGRPAHRHSAHHKRRPPWLKLAVEGGITLLLGMAALGLSLRWVSLWDFSSLVATPRRSRQCRLERSVQVDTQRTLSRRSNLKGIRFGKRQNRFPLAPGILSVVIRRDPSDGGPPSAFCTKFWLMTSSRETAEEGIVHGIFVKDGQEAAGPDEKAPITGVPNSYQREFAFSAVKLASDPAALSMEVAFQRMAVGLGYGKKIISFSYQPHSDAVAPTISFALPFSFEVNTTFPTSEQLSVRHNGVVLMTTGKPGEPVGALVTDSGMMQDKETILFLAAALLGTGVALIGEFCRAFARLFLPQR
jgi:hypothetical protein